MPQDAAFNNQKGSSGQWLGAETPSRLARAGIVALPFTGCGSLDKFLKFSVLQILHFSSEEDNKS